MRLGGTVEGLQRGDFQLDAADPGDLVDGSDLDKT